MILRRTKEVLILTFLITLTLTTKPKAKTPAQEPIPVSEPTETTQTIPEEQPSTTDIATNTSVEAETKTESVEPAITAGNENAETAPVEQEATQPEGNAAISDDKAATEEVATGYYNKVEKEVINNDIEAEPLVTVNQIKYRLTLFGLVLFLSSTLAFFGLAVLILSSAYYRVYLKQNKSAPFEAPEFLRLFFPKPVNYEYEINNLCSKYLDN